MNPFVPDNHKKNSVYISTFGGLTLTVDGEDTNIHQCKSPKVYQLLSTLVAFGGRNVPIHHIVDIMWPNFDGDKGLQNFEFILRKTRQTLKASVIQCCDILTETPCIIVHHGKVSFNSDCFMLDIWLWEALATQARQQRHHQHDEEAFVLEMHAAELIQGAFLQGDDEHVHFQQKIWHQRISNWLHQVIILWQEQQTIADEDIEVLMHRGLLLAPHSEKLFMQRLQWQIEQNYLMDALGSYNTWASLLRQHYGVMPPMPAALQRMMPTQQRA